MLISKVKGLIKSIELDLYNKIDTNQIVITQKLNTISIQVYFHFYTFKSNFKDFIRIFKNNISLEIRDFGFYIGDVMNKNSNIYLILLSINASIKYLLDLYFSKVLDLINILYYCSPITLSTNQNYTIN